MLLTHLSILVMALAGAHAAPVVDDSSQSLPKDERAVQTDKLRINLWDYGGYCLDVPWGNFYPGARVQLAKCYNTGSDPVPAQQWTADLRGGPKQPGSYRYLKTGPQLQYCLEIGGNNQLIINYCNGSPNQRWEWDWGMRDIIANPPRPGTDNGITAHSHNLLAINRNNQCVTALNAADGGNVQLTACSRDNKNQYWSMSKVW